MNNKTNDLNTLIDKGYYLDIGKILDISFLTFKKTFLYATVAVILLAIIGAFIFGGIFLIAFGASNVAESMLHFKTLSTDPVYLLFNVILSSLFSALLAPIFAGFIHINHLAINPTELYL